MKEIYRKAVQRTFAELYGVPARSVDVVWEASRITVHCAGNTFVRQTASNDESFVSEDEDPVAVTLTYEELSNLETAEPD
jgi:hypothetical protein